jgi:rhodanese-related sulfurtransferase|tara:strand:- start:60 stop:428 length:369 start_codon:yes stop_codon:yes gene_type:complete
MIEQIKSSEIKKYLEKNPKTVLLDVRTEEELTTVGKPKSNSQDFKIFFITIGQDSNFIENVKKQINKENHVLVMCAAGMRSMTAADLLEKEGYVAHNISDGFSGNGKDPGWKNSGLPSIIKV